MNRVYVLVSALSVLILLVVACAGEPEVREVTKEVTVVATPTPGPTQTPVIQEVEVMVAATPAPPAPAAAARELTLLVGGGQDTVSLQAYFPRDVRVRAGDTVTWKLNQDDEPHTVSFLSGEPRIPFAIPDPETGPPQFIFNPQASFPTRLPGSPVETYNGTGFVGSGIMLNDPPAPGAPPNNAITLVMGTPGIYEYVCLLHPTMNGTIVVEPATAAEVPSQGEIDNVAQAELAALLAETEALRDADPVIRQEPGPNGTTIWNVQIGAASFDQTGEVFDFLPKEINIQRGDTVVWSTVSPTIHTVTFAPGREAPTIEVVIPQPQGPPRIEVSSEVLFPHRPADTFDGTGYWNSGLIDTDVHRPPGGSSFSMTFSEPGSFDYVCAVHQVLGMAGTVNVTERQVSQVSSFKVTAAEFPEGLAVDRDGNIYAGMAPTGEIKKVTPLGKSTTFAQLPSPGEGFMLGMEFNRAGDLYVLMSSGDPDTHGIWRVSSDGESVERFAALEVEGFPNVLTFDRGGNLFVSDTTRGGIWKVDPQGTVSTWSDDPLLQGVIPPVSPLGLSLGANGVAFDASGQNLYVAVTEFGRIVRIPVNPDGSAGTAEVFTEDEGNLYDGITFDSSGNLYVAVVGQDRVDVISPEGDITTLAQGGVLQNPSDVRLGVGADRNTLYIANFALLRFIGLVPGTPRPGLLKITVEGNSGGPQILAAPLPQTTQGPAIPQDKGYLAEELGNGLYYVTEGTYQVMFLTTGEGVIVVDAPPSMGDKVLQAIAEVTDEPITHVIYSHSHADHIAGASQYPSNAAYIAHEDTAAKLALANDPNRTYEFGSFVGGSPVPHPTQTFSESLTLEVGSQTLQLDYRGPLHESGNIIIYAPEQKVLMLVDVIFPGWSPFLELAVAENVPAFVRAHDEVLSYEFETFIGGHLTRLGTRKDVEIQREYVLDMQANAAQALQTVDFMGIAQQTGFQNLWLLFGTYLDAVAEECNDLTLEKWESRLGGADLFTASHCARLLEALRIQ
ncbi:MAG: SMP-30/gluconolactonase/LRE family protein [Dehalococcoidia bacterium]